MIDGLGSVAALSKLNGSTVEIAEQYRYDAFGNTRVLNGSGGEITDPAQFCGNPYMFTARRLDPETRTGSRNGLYYYRARIYYPELGRFMQTDPIGYADSMNGYQYAFNSPTNYIDPSGLKNYLIIVGDDTDGFKKRVVEWTRRKIKKGDDYDPEEDNIIEKEIKTASEFRELLKNTPEIAELTYIGHANPEALIIDKNREGAETNISARGGRCMECNDSTSLSTMPTNNFNKDARIFLYSCRAGSLIHQNIAQAAANHFGVPVVAPSYYTKFDTETGRPYVNPWIGWLHGYRTIWPTSTYQQNPLRNLSGY